MEANKTVDIKKPHKSPKLLSLAQQLQQQHQQQPPKQESRDLEGEETSKQSGQKKKRAAVLVCIFEGEKDGEFRVFLTKRSSSLAMHSGDVALPGGKTDEGDADDVETALREAKEEIGLDPSLVHVVSVLQPLTMKNGMVVVPVVGILFDKEAFAPSPNVDEVESIFDVPLKMFLQNECRREEEKEWMGEKYLLHYFDYQTGDREYIIWALTAAVLIEAASVVYQCLPAYDLRIPSFLTRNR